MLLPPLEPERPPIWRRRRFRIGAAAVGAAAALAAVVVVIVGSVGGRSTPPRPKLAAPGRIVAYDTAAGRLVLERPDGSGRKVVPQVLSGAPNVSPDGRMIITDSGTDLFVVTSAGVRLRHSPVATTGGFATTPGQPFADHDRLLLAPRPFSPTAPVSLVPVRGGHARQLGTGDDASGDPSAAGAYVTIAERASVSYPTEPGVQIQPDRAVERRTAGGSTRVLATRQQLDRLAHVPASSKLLLSATASPTGRAVLVEAHVLRANDPPSVLAVYDAHQRLVAHLSGRGTGGFWSPDGAQIAYEVGRSMMLWRPTTGRTVTIPLPAGRDSWFGCIWSRDSAWITCAGQPPGQRPTPNRRLLVDVVHRRTQLTQSVDQPLTWLPTRAAPASAR